MNSLQHQLDRLFNHALTSANRDNSNLFNIPLAESTETDDALHLKLEVSDMEAKDLDVPIMGDRIAIALCQKI